MATTKSGDRHAHYEACLIIEPHAPASEDSRISSILGGPPLTSSKDDIAPRWMIVEPAATPQDLAAAVQTLFDESIVELLRAYPETALSIDLCIYFRIFEWPMTHVELDPEFLRAAAEHDCPIRVLIFGCSSESSECQVKFGRPTPCRPTLALPNQSRVP